MTMEEKIDFLMNAFMEMKEKVDSLIEITTTMQEDVKELKTRVTTLEKNHESMHRILILIEDDTSNKIPALFDGYSSHQQHIEEHDKRIETLETEVDNHSNRLWVLESSN